MSTIKSVLKKESSSNVVFDFKAREFPLVIGPSAQNFVSNTSTNTSNFQLNPLAAQQSGIAKLRADALNDKIEEEALLQLKQVQEKAYKEAYALGLSEGREQAFQEYKVVLEEKVKNIDSLIEIFEQMKIKLVADHEVHIVRMIYQLASRIAMREIKQDPTSILAVVQKVIADAQSDEQLMIRVAASDLAFLEEVRNKTGKASESIKRVKFDATEGMTPGGCLLESNYGSIDATIEMRVERAWSVLDESLPQDDQRSAAKPTDDGNAT